MLLVHSKDPDCSTTRIEPAVCVLCGWRREALSPDSIVSFVVVVEGMSSACDLHASNVSGCFFGLPLLFEVDGFVVPTSSGTAAAFVSNTAPWFVCFFFFFEADGVLVAPVCSGFAVAPRRVASSSSASSSSARLRQASHSSDTGLEAERQR